ncbi:MAG: collagen-like protein [Actinomycetota bacterium]|nr:collagen-like protein [Actinomycetota bacterium]
MKKRLLILTAAAALALASVLGAATAGAKSGPTAHAAKNKTGPRGFRGKTGPRGFTGFTGPAGATGSVGSQGPAGANSSVGGFTAFNQLVPFNGTETVTIGQFTVSEVAGPSACTNIQVVDQSSFAAKVSVIGGLLKTAGPGDFVALAPASTFAVAQASNGSSGDVGTFSAVLLTGTSSVTGTVGGVTLGTGCLTTGTLTGS